MFPCLCSFDHLRVKEFSGLNERDAGVEYNDIRTREIDTHEERKRQKGLVGNCKMSHVHVMFNSDDIQLRRRRTRANQRSTRSTSSPFDHSVRRQISKAMFSSSIVDYLALLSVQLRITPILSFSSQTNDRCLKNSRQRTALASCISTNKVHN
jgi:hypothetical protein